MVKPKHTRQRGPSIPVSAAQAYPSARPKHTRQRGPSSRQRQEPYWSNAHTKHRLRVHLVWAPKHRLRVHLVWVPKYRRRVLQGPVAARVEALLRQAAQVNRWQVHELAIQPDHVHLLIQIRPPESVSTVANLLKGGTSRVIRAEFPELEEFLWGEHFWAAGYFAESVGQVEEAVVNAYIRKQQR